PVGRVPLWSDLVAPPSLALWSVKSRMRPRIPPSDALHSALVPLPRVTFIVPSRPCLYASAESDRSGDRSREGGPLQSATSCHTPHTNAHSDLLASGTFALA